MSDKELKEKIVNLLVSRKSLKWNISDGDLICKLRSGELKLINRKGDTTLEFYCGNYHPIVVMRSLDFPILRNLYSNIWNSVLTRKQSEDLVRLIEELATIE